MDSFESVQSFKPGSSESVCTEETDDATNQSSTSSFLGASLDLDVHGLGRTGHLRHNQRDHHLQAGDSQDGFEESFMLEESFAMGESFAVGESFSFYDENGVAQTSSRRPARERFDISSALAIKDDDEHEVLELEEDKADASMHELEHQARQLSLKTPSFNFSVETH